MLDRMVVIYYIEVYIARTHGEYIARVGTKLDEALHTFFNKKIIGYWWKT